MSKCQVTGSRTLRGNNVPNSNKKTRKTIKNSVKDRRYYSAVLGKFITIKCTKRADDTILKFGGIDCFLINSRTSSLTQDMLGIKKTIINSMFKKQLDQAEIEKVQIGFN